MSVAWVMIIWVYSQGMNMLNIIFLMKTFPYQLWFMRNEWKEQKFSTDFDSKQRQTLVSSFNLSIHLFVSTCIYLI